MRVFNFHLRRFLITNNIPFSFPNRATLTVTLSPPIAFGEGGGISRVGSGKVQFVLDLNNGSNRLQYESLFQPFCSVGSSGRLDYSLSGKCLNISFECEDGEKLASVTSHVRFLLPQLLNCRFPDPPTITSICGFLGDTEFRWEIQFQEVLGTFHVAKTEVWEKLLCEWFDQSILLLDKLEDTNKRRVIAALTYLHRASRLIVAGDGPWEFMGEAVLNFAKILEVLFKKSEKSRDDIRAGLQTLGYENNVIERDFIAIYVIRNDLDVGHPSISEYSPNDLREIRHYLTNAESVFKELIFRILTKLLCGEKIDFLEEDVRNEGKDLSRLTKLIKDSKYPHV